MKKIFLILFGIFILALNSCKDDPPTSLPYTPPSNSNPNLQIGAMKLDDQTSNKVVSTTSSSVSFSSSVPVTSGTIIVADPNSKIPKGMLRKVLSVSSDGKNISTRMASLDEAFKKGEVKFSILPSQLKKVVQEGVFEKTNSPNSKTYNLNYTIYDVDGNSATSDDQLKLTGQFKLDGSISGEVSFPPFKIISNFSFSNELDLNLVATGTLKYSTEKTLFIAGGTPVVVGGIILTPEVSFKFKPEVEIYGEAETGINDKITLNSSITYYSGWNKNVELKNVFLAKPVEVSLNGKIKGTLIVELALYFYESIGPGVTLSPYLEMEADVHKSPWWSLYAGADGNFVVNTRGIASVLSDYSTSLFDTKRLIAQADSEPVNKAPYGMIVVTPAVGITTETNVQFSNLSSVDDITPQSKLVGRWDFESDGLWDIDYSPLGLFSHKYSSLGTYTVKMEVKDEGGLTNVFTKTVNVSQASQNHNPVFDYSKFIPLNFSNNFDKVNQTVSWSASDPDGDPLTYDLSIGENISSPELFSNLTNSYVNFVSHFPPGKKIYWRVKAKDNKGGSMESSLYNFTVKSNGTDKMLILQPDSTEGEDAEVKYFRYDSGFESFQGVPDGDSLRIVCDIYNYGQSITKREALLKFNISQISQNSNIKSAKLNLWGFGVINYSSLIPKISLVKLTGSWNENTVTWTNKPSYVQLLEKELVYEGEPSWYEFDVTSTIQNWVNGEANYGFGLRTEENTVSAWIYSSDYPESSKRPILEIIYQ